MIRFRMSLLAALLIPGLVLAQEPSKVESPKTEPVDEAKAVAKPASNEVVGQVVSEAAYQRAGAKPPVQEESKKVSIGSSHPFVYYTPTNNTYQLRSIYHIGQPLLDNFGLNLADADEVLRAQLELPADEGVVVVTVKPESLAHDAGLKPNDILLKLAGKPVKDAANVSKILLGLTREAMQVNLIRQGKPLQLSVVGPEHGIMPEANEFWLGVPVSPVDATLRAHLSKLAEVGDAGLVANDVVKDSPAEKAGVKKHDILLYLGLQPLKTTEGMIAAVQATEGKSTSLILLRAGKRLDLPITPGKRPRSAAINQSDLRFLYQNAPIQRVVTPNYAVTFSKPLSEAETARAVMESQQVPGPDGKIEVTHLLSGQKVRVDPNSAPNPQPAAPAFPAPVVPDVAKPLDRIYLQLQTAKPADPTTVRTDRLEAQMKELSTKLDEIRTLLEGLKKPEAK